MPSLRFDSADEMFERRTPAAEARLLEGVLARQAPEFYIVNRALTVQLGRADGSRTSERLPDDIAAAVKPLLASPSFDSAVVPVRRDVALRVMRLEGSDEPRYALFLERYRGRDLVENAVKKFALTAREATVLDEVMRGAATTEIAERLHITEGTVHQHVKNLGAKVGVTRRNAIVATILGLAAA